MKVPKLIYSLVTGLALTLVVTGCHTRHPQNVDIIHGRPRERVSDLQNAQMMDAQKGAEQLMNQNMVPLPVDTTSFINYVADTKMFEADTAHFDFDSSAVKAADKPKVALVADFLKGNAGTAVRVEGHCDERGTEEYNRSLGERRALALREELVRLGVDPNHVLTLSFGEDHPLDPAHDAAAWARNRRGEFVLLTPPK